MSLRIVLKDPANSRWLAFKNPVALTGATSYTDVMPTLQHIERRVNDERLFAVGFVTYDASPGFDAACVTRAPGPLPLLNFGLFESRESLQEIDAGQAAAALPHSWTLDTSQLEYTENVTRIREQIAAGNTYQVNYTMRGQTSALTDPWDLFVAIASDVPFAAYIETSDYAIVSASPELFFRLNGDDLVSKPMKGTAPRGLTTVDDAQRRHTLSESAKDRAENVMIADMLRNDMGRIALPGSVQAASLFDIEKYSTVWQATSTIRAQTHEPVSEIFKALFPCASITGAPKIASMQLIAGLEKSARGIYTGAIGYIGPDRQAQFSVAIRTACINRKTGGAEYGVGGGIVWDSHPDAEYAECLAKGRILRRQRPINKFQLFETLLWTQDSGYFLLDRHLSRINGSAEYFDFRIDMAEISYRLQRLEKSLQGKQHRVRLVLCSDGSIDLSETPIVVTTDPTPLRVRVATSPVDPDNVFLYHKTTHRKVYEDAISNVDDCDDVLLWNQDGFLTESTIANVAVRVDDRLCTPPVQCGLLPGTFREALLEAGELFERPVKVDELANAQEVVLLNSVRRSYTVQIV